VKNGPAARKGSSLDGSDKGRRSRRCSFPQIHLLPLDDCLYALRPSVPHLTRSSLHRCLQRHGISRLPEVEGDKAKKQKFATYPIGYFHIDIAKVQTEDGKLYMFVAADRTSKFAYAELHPRATRIIAKDFLDNLTKAVPSKIHTILTDNGIQFTKREGTEAYWSIPFDRLCDALGIGHRLTKVNHPWTNGQVERMNRTIKDATEALLLPVTRSSETASAYVPDGLQLRQTS
jgi:transposase-like protein